MVCMYTHPQLRFAHFRGGSGELAGSTPGVHRPSAGPPLPGAGRGDGGFDARGQEVRKGPFASFRFYNEYIVFPEGCCDRIISLLVRGWARISVSCLDPAEAESANISSSFIVVRGNAMMRGYLSSASSEPAAFFLAYLFGCRPRTAVVSLVSSRVFTYYLFRLYIHGHKLLRVPSFFYITL